MCGLSSLLCSLFVVISLLISNASHAGFTSTTTWPFNASGSCTDLTSCYDLIPMSPENSIYNHTKSSLISVSSNTLRVEYIYRHPQGNMVKSQYNYNFTPSSDCYMNSDGVVCGLPCNSAGSCLSFAASSCPDGVADFSYTNVANWTKACTTIIAGEFENNIEDLPSNAIQVGYAKGERGLQGQNGLNGRDGIDGIDGVDGQDGEDGIIGRDGIDGIDGIVGTNGIDGRDGIDGSNGTDGTDGTNGTNGFNGQDGAQGPIGATGAKGERGEIDDAIIEDLQRIDTLNIDRLNNLDQNDFEQDNLLSDFGADLGTAQADLFTLFQKDLVLETGQALIDADVETNEQAIASLGQAVEQLNANPPSDGIDGLDGTDGTDGQDGQTGAQGIAGLDGKDGTDGIDGIIGENGVDGLNGTNGVDGEDGQVVNMNELITYLDNTTVDVGNVEQELENRMDVLSADGITSPDINVQEAANNYLNDGVSISATCPVGDSIGVLGSDVTFSYQPMCDLATILNPLLLAFTWISAFVLYFRSL
jgi:hypothetical protein